MLASRRGSEIIPVNNQELLPPSTSGQPEHARSRRGQEPQPDITLAWQQTPAGFMIKGWLSDNWRALIRYGVIGAIVTAIISKIAPVIPSLLPLLVRLAEK